MLTPEQLVKVVRGEAPIQGLSPKDLAIVQEIWRNPRWRQASDETLRIRIQNMRLEAGVQDSQGNTGWSMR